MAEEAVADAAGEEALTDEEIAAAGGGPNKLLLIMIGVNTLLVAGLAVAFFLKSDPPPAPDPAVPPPAEVGEDGKPIKKEIETPPSAKMEPFIVNLNEPGGSRYLKVTMELQLNEDGLSDELEARKSQVRDLVISYLSSLTLADTQGIAGKESIKQDVARRLNDSLTTGKVTNVFFTEFILQ